MSADNHGAALQRALTLGAVLVASGCDLFVALAGGEGLACTIDQACRPGLSCISGLCTAVADTGTFADAGIPDVGMGTDARPANDAALADVASDRWMPDRWMPDQWMPDQWMPDRWMPDRLLPDQHVSDRRTPDRFSADIAVTDRGSGGIDAGSCGAINQPCCIGVCDQGVCASSLICVAACGEPGQACCFAWICTNLRPCCDDVCVLASSCP